MKKKLYLITNGFPYEYSEKPFLEQEVKALCKEFDLTIIASMAGLGGQNELCSDSLPQEWKDGIKVVRYQYQKNIWQVLKKFLIFWLRRECYQEMRDIFSAHSLVFKRLYKSAWFFVNAELFYEWLDGHHIVDLESEGIIYSYWYTEKVLAITLHKKKFVNYKIITRTHGYDLYDERVEKTVRQPFKRIMNRNLDKVFFASEYAKKYYMEKMGKDGCGKYMVSKIGTCPVTEEIQKECKEHFVLVSCSRVIKLKRITLLVDALSEWKGKTIEWHHFGDGEDYNNLKNYAMLKLDNTDCVQYVLHGYVKNEDIKKFYASVTVDCFITLSESEGGAPVSIQEAMAYGIPIIGTGVGGVTEMIQGNGVLLSCAPEIEEIHNAIKRVMELKKEEYERMSGKSREIWKEQYQAEANARKFTELLRAL